MSPRPDCKLCHGTGSIERHVGMEYPEVQLLECYCDPTPKKSED